MLRLHTLHKLDLILVVHLQLQSGLIVSVLLAGAAAATTAFSSAGSYRSLHTTSAAWHVLRVLFSRQPLQRLIQIVKLSLLLVLNRSHVGGAFVPVSAHST